MAPESASRPEAKGRAAAKPATAKGETVSGYFAALEPDRRRKLTALRKILKALLPKADECLSYGIPAFRNSGGVIVYYAAMKNHLSFFPTSYPIEACKADLKGYVTSRGTVRLPLDAPPPAALLKKLVRARLAQMAGKS
jgi:uncharacterized protein YdhG (YjbR/CyaY superfamily)